MPRMRNIAVACLLAVLVLATLSPAQQPPTKQLWLMLSTNTMQPMKIAGAPEQPAPGPTRTITGVAEYAQAAKEPIYLTVPADLALADNRLPLHVPETNTAGAGGETKPMELVTKTYWHPDEAQGPISDTLKMGAGRTGATAGAPDLAAQQAMGSENNLPPAVKGQGNYVLNTGGTATLDGYLAPLSVSAPDMSKLDVTKPIKVEWEAVPGARGYFLAAMGMSLAGAGTDAAKMTQTLWVSTLIEPPARVRGGYMQDKSIADDLKTGILLPAATTSCVIPGGIFKGINMLTLRVQAIGNDFYSVEGGVTVIGTIRSEWMGMAMLQEPEAMQQ